MNVLWLILIGLVGGVFGGMGMGGGTVMVPLLSLLHIEQISIQGMVLISFVPMSIVAIIIHGKNGRIDKGQWWLMLPAVVATVVASILAHELSNKTLTIIFGIMILALGVWQLVVAIKAMFQRHRDKDSSTQ